jgi:antirestriction protein
MDFDRRNDRSDDVYSKAVKAGKRTYFFDIKSTKGNDLYLTITESKKSTEGGREYFQKHKIFLYKEDFKNFQEGLMDVIAKIEDMKREGQYEDAAYFTQDDVDFDDL